MYNLLEFTYQSRKIAYLKELPYKGKITFRCFLNQQNKFNTNKATGLFFFL